MFPVNDRTMIACHASILKLLPFGCGFLFQSLDLCVIDVQNCADCMTAAGDLENV
jgi:hypothetical protein